MIELEFVGAAQTVTGSRHLLRTRHATVLLDCGLFQGRRRESFERNRDLPFDPAWRSTPCVLSPRAHRSLGRAPDALRRRATAGPIYATPATRDLCALMLRDAAIIQAADARYIERLIERGLADDPGGRAALRAMTT